MLVLFIFPYMGLVTTKSVFGVSDKGNFKSVCSATEASKKVEFSPVASLDMKLSKKVITKALISLRRCAGWSATVMFANPKDRFSHALALTMRCIN